MGDSTSISWTDATWNPIRGCRRTAPAGSKQSGCGDPTGGGCYAERQAARFSGPGGAYEGLITLTANGPRWSGKTKFVEDHLLDPIRWSTPRRIFTDSMSDLFFEGFADAEIDRVVAVMLLAVHLNGHIFQTLTKRAGRMRRYFSDPTTAGRVLAQADKVASRLRRRTYVNWTESDPRVVLDRHLWWGVSVENQAAADERIPELLETPAAVRFLSCEPLLGPVDLNEFLRCRGCGYTPRDVREHLDHNLCKEPSQRLDWVIAGCESGHGARTCEVPWLRSLRDQCASAGVAFFLKQAVETIAPDSHAFDVNPDGIIDEPIRFGDGSKVKGRGFGGAVIELPYLDDVQHAAFPEIRHG